MKSLQTAASQFNLTLTDAHLAQFQLYYETLISWNERVNLTRIVDREDVIVKHFLDSLSCFQGVPQLPQTVIDVGTGAGFPGVPLKIVQPHIALTLVEATGKKAAFLTHLIAALELSQVAVVNERAETVGQLAAYREKFDLAVARAVAPLNVLLEYLLPLLKPGGTMLALKSKTAVEEIIDAEKAFQILGGRLTETRSLSLPNSELARTLILAQKTGPTPKQYPRKPGTPSKRPLA